MNENEFIKQQHAAVERMREMNNRSRYGGNNNIKPPDNANKSKENNYNNRNNMQNKNSANSAKNVAEPSMNNTKSQKNNSSFPYFSGSNPLSFLDKLTKDGDTALIIGLLLILMSEKSDKMLIFALIYILI